MRKKIHIYINGMTCINCQNRIARKLNKTQGVINAVVSYEYSCAEIIYDDKKISFEQIDEIINGLGYKISDGKTKIIRNLFILPAIIIIYGMLFIIGLTTSIHCIAMCGGIIAVCFEDYSRRFHGNHG